MASKDFHIILFFIGLNSYELTEFTQFFYGLTKKLNAKWLPQFFSTMADDDMVTCDICKDSTNDCKRITGENWEYCSGLELQFCGKCRELRTQPPCEDTECQADVCYNKHLMDEEESESDSESESESTKEES